MGIPLLPGRQGKTVKGNGIVSEQYDYVWSDGKLVSQTYITFNSGVVATTNAAKFIYSDLDELQGFILNNSATYLYTKNLQGDITSIVSENGNTILNYTYDAWGKVGFVATSMNNMLLAYTLSYVSPFTYRGYCYDYDIELYYLQSRYYSADIGRFINTDDTSIALATQGDVLGVNLFAYCNNNSVMNVDYEGKLSLNQCWSYFTNYTNRIITNFYCYLKRLVTFNKTTRELSISTDLISAVIDAMISALVRRVVYKSVTSTLKVLLKSQKIRNQFIINLFNYLLYTKAGKVLLWAIMQVGFKVINKTSALGTFSSSVMKSYLSSLLKFRSTILNNSINYISALSSFGGILALAIDRMDGKSDGRFRVRV